MKSFLHTIIPASIISALASAIISYFCLYTFISGGLTELKTLSLLILPSIFYFVMVLIANLIFQGKYNSLCKEEKIIPITWWHQALILSALNIIFAMIFDYIYFFIDANPSISFSNALIVVIEATKEEATELRGLPFFMANMFTNAFTILVASLISSFVKRNKLT